MQTYFNVSTRYSLHAYRLQGPQVPCCDKHHSFIYFQDHREDQGAWRKYWGGLKVHLGNLGGAVVIYNQVQSYFNITAQGTLLNTL